MNLEDYGYRDFAIAGLSVILVLFLAAQTGVLSEAKFQVETKVLGQEVTEGSEGINTIRIGDSSVSGVLSFFSTVQESNIYPGDTITVCGDIYPESDTEGYHYTQFYLVSGGGFTPDNNQGVTKRVEKNAHNEVCLDTEVPDNTGTYEVAVWTTYDDLSGDQLGAKDSFTVEEEPPEPANADIQVDKTNVQPKEMITFDGSGSYGDGTLEYYWYKDSDDNMVSRSTTYTTSFVEEGSHTVYLEVMNEYGGSLDRVNINVEVNSPSADFTVSEDNVTLGRTVTLDASSSTKGSYNIQSYQWEAGSKTFEGASASYTPESEGRKNIRLTVTDSQGNTDSVSKRINVYDPTEPKTGLIETIAQFFQNLYPF